MTDDARQVAPSVERNREPILGVLRPLVADGAVVLEVASGSGGHVIHFAAALPGAMFQPSDPDPAARASIDAWVAWAGLANIRPAIALDATGAWPDLQADVVVCINMIHIAPWAATPGLMRGAAGVLRPGGALLIYGPYLSRDQPTAPGNIAFDATLRGRDPGWGIRDLETVAAEAARAGFGPPAVQPMPANNLCVTYRLPGPPLSRG